MEIYNIDDFKHLLQSGRLNFLIGSGLSSPYLKTLGEIENRLEALESTKDCTAKELARASIIKIYFDLCISKNYDLCHKPSKDSEEVLKNYKDFLHNINKIILLRRSNLLSKQINLFTTNVDIFLEKSLEEQHLEFNDGFTGTLNPSFELSNFKKSLYKTSPHYDIKSEVPIFNLLKLHGSVTWEWDGENSIKLDNKLNIIKTIQNNLDKLPDKLLRDATKEKNNTLKTIEELLIEYQDEEINEEIIQLLSTLKDSYDLIPMINPTKEKFKFTTLNYTYYELLRMFSNELEKENSILFVMGFSFADEHIREIVLRAINSNPTLIVYIFPYDNSAKEQIKECLGFQDTYPKNNNLKFVISQDKTIKNNLANINNTYFKKLGDSLIKPEETISAPKKIAGESNE
ncbi:TPA: hypothetical protein I8Z93_000958 [Legionella pneumophila]|nr:hypothetical protein [Legionella pneumophila]